MIPAKLAVSYAGITKTLQKYNFIVMRRFAIPHTPIHSLNPFNLWQSFCQSKQMPIMIWYLKNILRSIPMKKLIEQYLSAKNCKAKNCRNGTSFRHWYANLWTLFFKNWRFGFAKSQRYSDTAPALRLKSTHRFLHINNRRLWIQSTRGTRWEWIEENIKLSIIFYMLNFYIRYNDGKKWA